MVALSFIPRTWLFSSFGKNFTLYFKRVCWCIVDTQCCASLRAQQSAPVIHVIHVCHTCVHSFPESFPHRGHYRGLRELPVLYSRVLISYPFMYSIVYMLILWKYF